MVYTTISVKPTPTQTEFLEDKISNILAKEIQREIDESLMLGILVQGGWTKVSVQTYETEILDWCEKNLTKDQWKFMAGYFVIRKKKEAEWFILRWA